MRWQTRATAFAWTVDDGRLLTVLHERLGTALWEVPGGHVENGETFEEAAARETHEETGVNVEVSQLIATCVHEWPQRGQRHLVLFFRASPAAGTTPCPGEEEITRAEWRRHHQLQPEQTSPFLHPILRAWDELDEPGFAPITFRAEHRRGASGRWHPHVVHDDEGQVS